MAQFEFLPRQLADGLRHADSGFRGWAGREAQRVAQPGIDRNRAMVMDAGTNDNARKQAIAGIMYAMKTPADQQQAVRGQLEQQLLLSEAQRRAMADQHAAGMPRGFGGMAPVGPREAIAQKIHDSAAFRRYGFPLATIGIGAGVTAGAQQLLDLMGFMQEGQQTQQRAAESPIA